MMTGIPASLAEAFRNAVFALDNARRGLGGDYDPSVPPMHTTIGTIADLAMFYDDALPDDVYAYLVSLAPYHRRIFTKTYAAAGELLYEMYHAHLEHCRKRDA